MNCGKWYINILIKYPYLVLAIVSILSSICLIVPFTMKNVQMPNFQDPELVSIYIFHYYVRDSELAEANPA